MPKKQVGPGETAMDFEAKNEGRSAQTVDEEIEFARPVLDYYRKDLRDAV